MREHRHTVISKLKLRKDTVGTLQTDPTLRLMLYCTAEEFVGQLIRKLDLSFPHQVELRVNQQDVKANFRGLKNKPGSTRPVDVTSRCRLIEGFENTVAMTYALTQKVKPRTDPAMKVE